MEYSLPLPRLAYSNFMKLKTKDTPAKTQGTDLLAATFRMPHRRYSHPRCISLVSFSCGKLTSGTSWPKKRHWNVLSARPGTEIGT